MAKKTEKPYKCAVCGWPNAGRIPKGGDGSYIVPRRHKVNGVPCPGNNMEAEDTHLLQKEPKQE